MVGMTKQNVCLEEYHILSCSRLNKKGGGVVLYIRQSLQHKHLPEKSKCIENCAEILSVEITLEKEKKQQYAAYIWHQTQT